MSWRTFLMALLGLLLPLPLAWLLYTAMSGHDASLPSPQGKVLIPMLAPEERLRLRTHEQDCITDADCESPLRCFFNVRTQVRSCTDSTCMTDLHCADGFACRTLGTDSGKARVRACSLVGVRKEGEECVELPSIREEGCEKGLLCHGFCGRPCRLDEPSSCPEGYFCDDGDDGPSCLPTCEGRSCPEGQRCVPRAGRASVCATVYGQDCERTSCPQELDCSVSTYPWRPGKIWMECLRACGENHPPCPEGTVCHLYQCHKSCGPEDSSACGPGFVCSRREPRICVPGSRARTGG